MLQLVKQISRISHVRMCTGVSSLCIHTISDGVVKRESIAEARASSMCLLIDYEREDDMKGVKLLSDQL